MVELKIKKQKQDRNWERWVIGRGADACWSWTDFELASNWCFQ